MTVVVRDRGARRVLREVNRRRSHVDVGVLGSKASQTKRGARELTVADVARWAEMGLGQPQRSWLRGWIDTHTQLIEERISKEIRDVLKGKRSREQALKRIGVWLQGELQQNIANHPDNGFKPNAASTIARKGSSTPLIDTGQLRSSISHRTSEQ